MCNKAKPDPIHLEAIKIAQKAQRDLMQLTGQDVSFNYTIADTSIDPRKVIDIVIDQSDITRNEFFSGKSTHKYTAYRFVAICLIGEFFPVLSSRMVSEILGDTVRSTIVYAWNKKADYMATQDKHFYPLYCKAKQQIQSLITTNESSKA